MCLPFSPGSCTQFFVEVREDKPGVGVVLHQTVDFPLSCQKTGRTGLIYALDDSVSGMKIQVDLCPKRNIHFNEEYLVYL